MFITTMIASFGTMVENVPPITTVRNSVSDSVMAQC